MSAERAEALASMLLDLAKLDDLSGLHAALASG